MGLNNSYFFALDISLLLILFMFIKFSRRHQRRNQHKKINFFPLQDFIKFVNGDMKQNSHNFRNKGDRFEFVSHIIR